ncbi:MAG TPA: hypothetical protein VIG74_06565 [Alphaproteobacteria bacterium]
MALKLEQYDPMFMDTQTCKALFNDVARQVGSVEGRAYADIGIPDRHGRAANAEDYDKMNQYIEMIAHNFSAYVSTCLFETFGHSAPESAEVKEVYRKIREASDQHFEQQTQIETTPKAKVYNARIDLFAATNRAVLDSLMARLG